jgi:hypothetical protein
LGMAIRFKLGVNCVSITAPGPPVVFRIAAYRAVLFQPTRRV